MADAAFFCIYIIMDWKKFFGGFGFGDLLNFGGGIAGSLMNYFGQKSANKANMQIAQQANEAQAAESEKAYQRSKAGNQVGLMQQAGMSQAGAINALNGGGSYTPAPVNTAQVEAPQLDMSFLSSIASNAMQARTAEAQLKQQAEQFKQEQDLKERQFNEEQLNNKVTRDLNEAQRKLIQTQTGLTEKQVDKLCADTELTFAQIKSEAAKYDLTLAQIVKTQEETNLTTQQILRAEQELTKLKAEFAEWNSIDAQDTRAQELSARKMHAMLQAAADEYDFLISEDDLRSLRNSLKHGGVFDNGSIPAQVNEYWRKVSRIIPLETVARILSLVFKKG